MSSYHFLGYLDLRTTIVNMTAWILTQSAVLPFFGLKISSPRSIGALFLCLRPKTGIVQSFQFLLIYLVKMILIAFVSPNMGKQVRATTSSKVGPNSPEAAMKVWVSTLQ